VGELAQHSHGNVCVGDRSGHVQATPVRIGGRRCWRRTVPSGNSRRRRRQWTVKGIVQFPLLFLWEFFRFNGRRFSFFVLRCGFFFLFRGCIRFWSTLHVRRRTCLLAATTTVRFGFHHRLFPVSGTFSGVAVVALVCCCGLQRPQEIVVVGQRRCHWSVEEQSVVQLSAWTCVAHDRGLFHLIDVAGSIGVMTAPPVAVAAAAAVVGVIVVVVGVIGVLRLGNPQTSKQPRRGRSVRRHASRIAICLESVRQYF
jgi:uncharacterized membrane protein HdeD (DUF308 family)